MVSTFLDVLLLLLIIELFIFIVVLTIGVFHEIIKDSKNKKGDTNESRR